jgi:hypothetical protein
MSGRVASSTQWQRGGAAGHLRTERSRSCPLNPSESRSGSCKQDLRDWPSAPTGRRLSHSCEARSRGYSIDGSRSRNSFPHRRQAENSRNCALVRAKLRGRATLVTPTEAVQPHGWCSRSAADPRRRSLHDPSNLLSIHVRCCPPRRSPRSRRSLRRRADQPISRFG